MNTYTTEQLIERINLGTREEILTILTRILKMRTTDTTRAGLAKIIMETDTAQHHKAHVNLAEGRVIPIAALRDLVTSPMMEFIPFLIEAALSPEGPYQSREIMLYAAALHPDGKAYYITTNGIDRKHKTQAGYILSMAGLDRKSHYDAVTKKPVKAWKLRNEYRSFTLKQRVQMVHGIIREQLQMEVKPTPMHLEDLI